MILFLRDRRLFLPLLVVALVVGCRNRQTQFEPDRLLRAKNGLNETQAASIDAALREWFGTPDEPRLPEELPKLASLLDMDALEQASGPVSSQEAGITHGLYRRHCARCHGITGNGRGPTALYQAPYPRDFRRGVFKWKSTYRSAPPTTDDLHATLERGIPGTAMPSLALLRSEERDTLRQYVQYLAIRGEAERTLVDFVANELPAGEALVLDEPLRKELLSEWIGPIVHRWIDAEEQRLEVAAIPTDPSLNLREAGRELYHGEQAGCYKCHGPAGEGGSIVGKDFELDYDIWNRDRLVPNASDKIKEMLNRDLPLRASQPRQLVGTTLHGGSSLSDLYNRIHQGIAGTPMPAAGGATADEQGALTDEEILALTIYVRTLLATQSSETPVAKRTVSGNSRSRLDVGSVGDSTPDANAYGFHSKVTAESASETASTGRGGGR